MKKPPGEGTGPTIHADFSGNLVGRVPSRGEQNVFQQPAGSLRYSNAGFSLVEVMCAIIILGIALVGLTQGTTTALSSSKESELQTTAALIAAGKIEMLRADGYVLDGITDGECGEGLSLYRWKRSVTSTTIEGLHEVAVVVENSKTGTAIYELRTLLFDPPTYSSSDGSGDRKDSPKSRKKERKM